MFLVDDAAREKLSEPPSAKSKSWAARSIPKYSDDLMNKERRYESK
jgi:hypothetical protein